MSINRLTRERLFQDERLFNHLLPYAKYDPDFEIFVHSDASLWCLFELQPLWITKTSDADAFQLTERIQEMLDSMDHSFSVQFCWITTFDIDFLLRQNINRYPVSGPAGWMARRWMRMLRRSARHEHVARRPAGFG